MSDFPRCTWIGAPVARAPACAGVRATRSVGILSPDFFPMYLIGAPVAWASAHAGGRVAFHVHRQVVRRQPGPAFSFYADMGRRGGSAAWKDAAGVRAMGTRA